MRTIAGILISALLLIACNRDINGVNKDMGVACVGGAADQCAVQCGGDPSNNVCYPDPVGPDPNGCFECFCQPCIPADMTLRGD